MCYVLLRLYLQPPTLLRPASLRDAGVAALCGGSAGMWLLLARVWLCDEDLFD